MGFKGNVISVNPSLPVSLGTVKITITQCDNFHFNTTFLNLRVVGFEKYFHREVAGILGTCDCVNAKMEPGTQRKNNTRRFVCATIA